MLQSIHRESSFTPSEDWYYYISAILDSIAHVVNLNENSIIIPKWYIVKGE